MQQESLRQMLHSLAIRCLHREGIEVSAETLRRLLKENPVLQQERKNNQRPLRRREAQFGELIQLDGSPQHWFGPQRNRACLMAFTMMRLIESRPLNLPQRKIHSVIGN